MKSTLPAKLNNLLSPQSPVQSYFQRHFLNHPHHQSGTPARLRTGLFLCVTVATALTACQQAPVMSTDQRLQLGLGVAQSARLKDAEKVLTTVLQEYQQTQNTAGIAKASFGLAELYKSKRYQDQLTPPSTTEHYQQAATLYVQSAQAYQSLHRPALQASALVGAANAYLLSDQVAPACTTFAQAQDLAELPAVKADQEAYNSLTRSMRFFSDLAVVCALAQPL